MGVEAKLSNFWVCEYTGVGLYRDGGRPWVRRDEAEAQTMCDRLNLRMATLLKRTDAPWSPRRAYVTELISC